MLLFVLLFFFFKQKTAYEMRISDWSSDVCSSDLHVDGYQIVLQFSEKVNDTTGNIIPDSGSPFVLDYKWVSNMVSQSSNVTTRSEERRVGKECVSRVDLGGCRIIKKKKNHT